MVPIGNREEYEIKLLQEEIAEGSAARISNLHVRTESRTAT